jgi:hypothetical protein
MENGTAGQQVEFHLPVQGATLIPTDGKGNRYYILRFIL